MFQSGTISSQIIPLHPVRAPERLPLHIRPYKVTDFPDLAEIKLACLRQRPDSVGMSARMVEKEYSGALLMQAFGDTLHNRLLDMHLLVATCSAEIIGYCRAVRDLPGDMKRYGYGTEIDSLFVHPDWQGGGAGGRLLSAMRHKLHEAQRPLPYVKVCSETPALDFYLNQGAVVATRLRASSMFSWVMCGFAVPAD